MDYEEIFKCRPILKKTCSFYLYLFLFEEGYQTDKPFTIIYLRERRDI